MVATISTITSGTSRVAYFEKDGYYAKDDPEHSKGSFWYGTGAEKLGLEGHVKADDLDPILQGIVLGTDDRLGRYYKGEFQHRPGFDLTFSAPKSISLAALVMGDNRILTVHDKAVRTTIQYIEENLLETRTWDPHTGKRPRISSPSMVAAVFQHTASRNLDPQLHSHCVIANMTEFGDGNWRSVEPTALRQNLHFIGAFYRNELAGSLRELGYDLVQTTQGRMQSFEIAGYDRNFLEAFSTRRTEIRKYMEERGWENNPAMAQKAALLTRARKDEPDRATMRQQWIERAHAPEFAHIIEALTTPRRTAALAERLALTQEQQFGKANEAVGWAVEHLEERKLSFSWGELAAAALTHSPGQVNMANVEAAIDELRDKGRLLDGEGRRGAHVFTTDQALAMERDIIKRLEHSAGTSHAIDAKTQSDSITLTLGQEEAKSLILESTDRIVGVQGMAGSGKTTMLSEVKEASESQGYNLLGLAPTASAARTLQEGAGIPSRTLQGFLHSKQDLASGLMSPAEVKEMQKSFKDTILVIDEASLTGLADMHTLMRVVDQIEPLRVALVGDMRQLNGVGAGAPFRLMQYAGMETVRMTENVRQTKDSSLHEVVEMASLDLPAKALHVLERDGMVIEAERGDLSYEAASQWLELDHNTRDNTLIMAPLRWQRDEINEHIRTALIENGEISGEKCNIDRLVSYGMTRAEKKLPENYHPGDAVVFAVDSNRAGLVKNEIYTVTGRDDDFVMLRGRDGKEAAFDPGGGQVTRLDIASRLDVYGVEEITLQAGDLIRWTRNDNELGLLNSRLAHVLEVDDGGIRIMTDDKREMWLDKDNPQLSHCDFGWASTVHAAQGKTADHVIAILDADSPMAKDAKAFYVEISRARDGVTLITDDKFELSDALSQALDNSRSAHEILGQEGEIFTKEVGDNERNIERDLGEGSEKNLGEDFEGYPSVDVERDLGAGLERDLSADLERDLGEDFERNLSPGFGMDDEAVLEWNNLGQEQDYDEQIPRSEEKGIDHSQSEKENEHDYGIGDDGGLGL